MPLPPELSEVPEETTVIGDVDAFMDYVYSGAAERDWYERIAFQIRQLEVLL